MFIYTKTAIKYFEKVVTTNKEEIGKAAMLVADVIKNRKIIHTMGTGHSHIVGEEISIRAGGLANINPILDSVVTTAGGAKRAGEMERTHGIAQILWDNYTFSEGDIIVIVSNSGRNAVPVEFAEIAKKNGFTVIVITSLEQSKKYPSRVNSGKKLYEYGDIVIDNCVPSGDGIINVGGISTGGISTLVGIMTMHTIITEAILYCHENKIDIPILTSQNIDGYNNNVLYAEFEDRIKHL